jgi:hypothetical protein
MTFKIGDWARCDYDFGQPTIPASPCGRAWPVKGEVYRVREIDKGKKNPQAQYLLFDGLAYTPEVSFAARRFKRVRRRVDYSELMNPKTVWEPADAVALGA